MNTKNDNKKAAAQMAADAAKTLITIAVAAAGATLAYFQFLRGSSGNFSISYGLICVAVAAYVISMIAGMIAISTIYKKGEGREGAQEWSTQVAKKPLGAQSGFGLLGLACLGLAIFLGPGAQSPHWSIDTPNGNLAHVFSGKRIEIYGNWNELYIRDDNQDWIRLERVPPGQRRYIGIKQ